ncbi:dihydroorotate oxidase A [Litorimonas taeanensis]|uniref:Dihydroorotate dehydrogenase (quinone) n=1 Tax=Litorimonas taeanensis TaxID=568099 RepID=A0A420WFM6_9PROT|nr:quinone-dependent dihydroorotate dehydrogenase [Litorimonas taeanensis]RKQ69814.1 dihydroorotate oxidase A [Litorimonas taeanensis]
MTAFYKFGTAMMRTLPAERAHLMTIKALKAGLGPKNKTSHRPELQTKVGGLTLPNPVGLAAGFDKNCEVPDAMLSAGFGFVECGTVTPRPQVGNPKPRLFRLSQDEAVINRMGFNNKGLDDFSENLRKRQGRLGLLGANLGANKESDDRIADYVTGLARLWGQCDYFTINISSPNTPGLRNLQGSTEMDELLDRLSEAREALAKEGPAYPMFLKVAPDLDFSDVGRVVEQARNYGLNAIIISNTTIDRPSNLKDKQAHEGGGLSGQPLFEKSTALLSEFHNAANGKIDLIGVGGIGSGAQAYAKIKAGANAVQLYSALVYKGPQLVQEICEDLSNLLKADGYSSINEAVGTA